MLCPESTTIDGDIHKYVIVVHCVLQLGIVIVFVKVIYTSDECVNLSAQETWSKVYELLSSPDIRMLCFGIDHSVPCEIIFRVLNTTQHNLKVKEPYAICWVVSAEQNVELKTKPDIPIYQYTKTECTNYSV